jgi:tetraacyldisaccharide 4'-kinase
VAIAGVANPEAFFDDLRRAGWPLAETLPFPDHHRYTRHDVERIAAAARRAKSVVVTTEKDYVRLLPFRPWAVSIHYVPLTVEPSPFDRFRDWIAAELQSVRGAPRG